MTVRFVVTFLALWAGSAMVLSCLPWFQPRGIALRPSGLSTRDDEPGWVHAVEVWLAGQARSR